MLKYLSFKMRILLGFAVIISLMTVISVSSLINLSNTAQKLAELNSAKYQVNHIHQLSTILWAMFLTVTAVALATALFLTRHLCKQIGIDPLYAKGIAKEIASGNLSRTIHLDADDKNSLLYAIKNMQQKLLASRTAEHKATEEILRIKIALDSICTGVMITDNDRNIIYANNAMINILGKTETYLQKQLPGFSVANLIGINIDDLHQNPKHQAQLLSSLKGTYKAGMQLGNRSMAVTANPIVNGQGQRLGTVAE